MRTLLLVCAGRTGSSRVVNQIAQINGVLNFGELFHPNKYSLKHTLTSWNPDAVKDQFPFLQSSEGRHFCRQHPDEALISLGNSLNADTAIVKVFPKHLEPEELKKLFKAPLAGVIFLARRPVDSFISLTKARLIKQWESRDTSDIQVELDVGRFLSYVVGLRRHYSACREHTVTSGINSALITYEDHIALPDQASQAGMVQLLGKLGLDVETRQIAAPQFRLTRQDNALGYEEKVANWDAFCLELAERGFLWTLGHKAFVDVLAGIKPCS